MVDQLNKETKIPMPENCVHHWIIEPANGPTSWGTCQICWKTKPHNNYVTSTEYSPYNRHVDGSHKPLEEEEDE